LVFFSLTLLLLFIIFFPKGKNYFSKEKKMILGKGRSGKVYSSINEDEVVKVQEILDDGISSIALMESDILSLVNGVEGIVKCFEVHANNRFVETYLEKCETTLWGAAPPLAPPGLDLRSTAPSHFDLENAATPLSSARFNYLEGTARARAAAGGK